MPLWTQDECIVQRFMLAASISTTSYLPLKFPVFLLFVPLKLANMNYIALLLNHNLLLPKKSKLQVFILGLGTDKNNAYVTH